MPPKASKPAGCDGADPKFAFVWSVLRHAGELNVDWNGVAEDNGIGYARNASSKFKDIVKKQGFKFEGNKICLPDETPTAATPTKPATTRKRKATVKKEEDNTEKEPKTTAKKTKKPAPKSAPTVKEEDEEAEDDDEEVKEEEEA